MVVRKHAVTTRPEPVTPADLGGPVAGTPLCRVADLANGRTELCRFGAPPYDREVFIVAVGESVAAYVNDCPHQRLPLDWKPGQFLDWRGQHILCANHGARFRPEDGLCVDGPCRGEWLTPVKIRVTDEHVLAG